MAKTKLISAPEDQKFWVCNGAALTNLSDLASELTTMTDNDFSFHVTKDKNDFAAWTGDVLKEKNLATSLKKVKTRKGTLKKINDRLK